MINNELFFAAEVLNTISEERGKDTKIRRESGRYSTFTLNLFKRRVIIIITKNDDDK